MLALPLYLCYGLISYIVLASGQSLKQQRKPLAYKLPDGYSIERHLGVGDLESFQVYGAVIVAMINLAYEDSRNLTDPVSYSYPGITLNITGADETSPYYRQFASYVLWQAIETMDAQNNFTTSNFTLQNKAGGIACNVIFAPPNALWQQIIGGSSGGLSPREHHQTDFPAVLETRQGLTNESAALEKLIPLYTSDWYGPASPTPQDFFMALATMIVQVADSSDKDRPINYESVESYGLHLNVTNVPLSGQRDYFTDRGVLNICAYAYGQLSKRLGYGTQPITNFESTLVWTNGTEVIQQHVLRYEGALPR